MGTILMSVRLLMWSWSNRFYLVFSFFLTDSCSPQTLVKIWRVKYLEFFYALLGNWFRSCPLSARMLNYFFNPSLLTCPSFLKLIAIFCLSCSIFFRLRGVTAFAQHCISLCQLPEWAQPTMTGSLKQSAVVIMFSLVPQAAQLPESCQHLVFAKEKTF